MKETQHRSIPSTASSLWFSCLERDLRRVLLLILICISSGSAEAEPRFWGHLHSGRFGVGFRIVRATDGTELHVWYPAVTDSRSPLTMADYLRLSRDLKGAVHGFETDAVALRQTLALTITGELGVPDEPLLLEILRTPFAASRDAQPAPGRFPLVLWTHRYATTAAQSVLNEYLASYGFVVVYAAAKLPPLLPSEFKTPTEKSAELKRQVRRLRVALSRSRAMANVRPQKVAVMAWGYAGESAHALQRTEPSIKAVIGLASNVLDNWEYETKAEMRREIAVPYILLDGSGTQPPTAMNGARSRTFFVRIEAMSHSSFDVLEGMVPSVMGIQGVPSRPKAGPEEQLGYEVASQYVLRALEHYLYAVPTLDTPFRLWSPDGIKEGFVQIHEGGAAPQILQQPKFEAVQFVSPGELPVTADLYTAGNRQAPTILLVHQSSSSRGEYRQIAPHLLRLGFNALAVDTRWGGRDFWNGVVNETATRYGTPAVLESRDVKKMRPVQEASVDDIRAALRWLSANGYPGPKLLWGSSISANLALKLAAEEQNEVAAVLSFSPGEYHPDFPRELRSAIGALRIPALIASGVDEEDTSKPIFDALPTGNKQYYRAVRGRHGSSILLDDPANWSGIEPFLRAFGKTRTDVRNPNRPKTMTKASAASATGVVSER
jgi:dienelactone hydrolase